MATGLSALPFQTAGRVSRDRLLPLQKPDGLHSASSWSSPSTSVVSRRRPRPLACQSMEAQSEPAKRYLTIDHSSKIYPPGTPPPELYTKFPPLPQSLVIEGITPQREVSAKDVATSRGRIAKIAEDLWPNSPKFLRYCDLAISMTQFYFCEAPLEQFIVLSIMYAVWFILDDDIFDDPTHKTITELMNGPSGTKVVPIDPDVDLGVNPGTVVWDWIQKLDELLRMKEMPPGPFAPVDRTMFALGQEVQRTSPRGFVNFLTEAVLEHHRIHGISKADFSAGRASLRDVDAYMQMRLDNVGGVSTVALAEFVYDEFLDDEVRDHPFTKEMTRVAVAHGLLVNDIFSYSKEINENNPCNVIAVLIETEGMSVPQATWRAIELTNAYHEGFISVENRLRDDPSSEPVKGSRAQLLTYLRRLRELYSGNIYWSSLVIRYRVPDAVFPDLRAIPYPHQHLQRFEQQVQLT